MCSAMDIKPIVEAQNAWWREPALRVARHHPVRRDLQPVVLRRVHDLEDRRALLLLGPRQVGKTTLLEQVIDDLLEARWPAANLTYFDFSDDRLVNEVTAREVTEIAPVGLDDSRPRVFLFDEISKAPRWDRWLKQAVDCGAGKVVATDSAASVLRGGARESGQGRWDELRIDGLSFREFLRLYLGLAGGPEAGPHRFPAAHPEAFERYLALGGFPEHARSENLPDVRRRLRSDIVERAILRDLAGRVDDPGRVRDLFVYLMQESGGELVSSHRADDLGADRRSVEAWIELLEETFLVSRLERRREKASKRLRSRPKLYAADHGLVEVFAASPDPVNDPEVRAKVFEAVAYRHLRDVAREAGAELTYLRIDEGREVDFVLDTEAGPVAVEVTHSRRIKAEKLARLEESAGRIGAVRRVLIHGGAVEEMNGERAGDVVQLPLARFLLEPEIVLPVKEERR
jgi:uncharacterized protein